MTVNQLGDLVVAFRINEDAAAEFQAFTKANIGQPMAIVVDNVVVTSPVINAPIFTDGVIEGLDDDEVLALVVQLTTEPLPGRIELLGVERRD